MPPPRRKRRAQLPVPRSRSRSQPRSSSSNDPRHDAEPLYNRDVEDEGAAGTSLENYGERPGARPTTQDPTEELTGGFTLSDADVQILYEILRLAQDSPLFTSQPFHAIFPAYRDVLAHHDITTSNDRTYLRFLYRLEQQRRTLAAADADQTLFEAFETRLAQLGIELRFSSSEEGGDDNDDDDGNADADNEDSRRIHARPHAAEIAQDARDWRPRERRASYSSFVDFEETARPRPHRAGSRGSVSRLQDHSEGFGAHMPVARSQHRGEQREDPRPVARQERPKASAAVPIRREISTAAPVTPTQPRRTTRPGWRKPDPQLLENYLQTTGADSVTESVVSEDGSAPMPTEDLPSRTQLVRDAATYNSFRIKDLARNLIRQWKDKAVQRQWEYSTIMKRADALHEDALTRRVFHRLREMYRLRKHMRCAEEVYTLWQERAQKARDNYLLTKAFTHWEACTSEERERSAFARRHVLRVKFFNAWREVTAVNKLRAQQQVLAKFFDIWKQKFVQTWVHENKAVTFYDDHLAESTYWKWFWKFCEERAPQWREALLKRRYLQRMVEALASKKELENHVTELRNQELLYRHFGRWQLKQKEVVQQDAEALRFRHTHIVAGALPQWQRQLKLARPAQQVAQMVRTRVIAGAFQTWAIRYRMAKHANHVNEVRIMRNAWTTWNDRLRVEVMQRQINDRVAVQALYKWVLVEREVLLKRIHGEELVRRAWETIKARRLEVTVGLANVSEQFASLRDQRLKRSILQNWRKKSNFLQEQNTTALQHYEPRALGNVMRRWHAKYDRQTELSRWAVEALYYVRTSRTIKTWQAGVSEKKKRKIQEAYATVRVEQKKKQARATLELLRDRLQHVRELELAAHTFYDQSTKVLLSQLLAQWLERLGELQGLARSAEQQRTEILLSDAFATWQQRAQLAQQQHTQSVSLATMHVEKTAYEGLRKLQLRSLELQNLRAKADTIRSWNSKRYARKLLRLWWEQSVQRRNLSNATTTTATPSFVRTVPVPSRLRSFPSELSSSETLTGLKSSQQAPLAESEVSQSSAVSRIQHTSPPVPMSASSLPGYLSTPSKRAARARNLIAGDALSFTPATDPRAMRRAHALLHSGIAEDDLDVKADPDVKVDADAGADADTGDSLLDTPRAGFGSEPLTRTLFRRSQRLGIGSGSISASRGSLQTPTILRGQERSSRTAGSLIPRSTLFQDRTR